MSRIKHIRDLPVDQLEVMIEDLEKDLYNLRCELRLNKKVEKTHLFQDKKRDKARALMVLAEKQKDKK